MMRKKKGFTLVELSLALALIGVLSIIVILLIGNAVSAYHRGLTLNQINTVGMGLTDDLRVAVQSSPGRFDYESDCQAVYENISDGAGKSCVDDKARSFVAIERYADVKIGSNTVKAPVYGAFCTGKYSYIWNSGYFFNTTDYAVQSGVNRAQLKYLNAGDSSSVKTTTNESKLLKVQDENRAVCKAAAGAVDATQRYLTASGAQSSLSNEFDIACTRASASTKSTEICGGIDDSTIDTDLVGMNSGYGGIALYDLTAVGPASSAGTNNLFYSVSFILGTIQGGINVMAQGNYCATPEGYDSGIENFDYCAINKFNFAAQATGV